jgi:CBS domain-containing protein
MPRRPTTAGSEAPAVLLARTPVRSAMQLGLFECEPDADLRALARRMAERKIHAVVVPGVAWPGGPVGRRAWRIVSDVELMRGLRPRLEQTTAGALATTEVVSVLPSETLDHADQLMADHDTAHLVVVSPETGRPVGMVSTLDIARVAAGI